MQQKRNHKPAFIAGILLIGSLLCTLVVAKEKTISQQLPPAIFTGRVINFEANDSIRVLFLRNIVSMITGAASGNLEFHIKVDDQGRFNFELPSSGEPSRLDLNVIRHNENGHRNSLISAYANLSAGLDYIVEPGDSIHVEIVCVDSTKSFLTTFSGRGAGKYQCAELLAKKLHETNHQIVDFSEDAYINKKWSRILTIDFQNLFNKPYQDAIRTIDSMKVNLTSVAANILKADAYGYCYYLWVMSLDGLYTEAILFPNTSFNHITDDSLKKALPHFIDRLQLPILGSLTQKVGNDYALSETFKFLVIHWELLHAKRNAPDSLFNFTDLYYSVKKLPTTPFLKEKLLAECLFNPLYSAGSKLDQTGYDSCFADALTMVKTPYLKTRLLGSFNTRRGATALNFALPDSSGKIVHLSDFKGKVILQDSWFTGCKGCAFFHQRFERDVYPLFKDNPDFVVISINLDKDKAKWLKSAQTDKYTSKSYINVYTDGKGDDSPVFTHYLANLAPFLLIIDRSGKVYTRIFDNDSQEIVRDIQEVLAKQ